MTYTFAEAKMKLARHVSAFGLTDLSGSVNEALDELSHTRTWQRMRKLVRFTVSGEYFALPQDCGSLIRCAIDGNPVSVAGTDYEFLSSGPGDLDYVCQGYAPLYKVQRLGLFPTMYGVGATAKLAAFSETPPTGDIKVKYRNSDNDLLTVTVPCTQWGGPAALDALNPATVSATAEVVDEVLAVALPSDAEDYVSLYSIEDGEFRFLSRMHPREKSPEFTRYRMAGFSAEEGATYRMIAECGLRFLPLVNDEDPVPFGTLRPVQYMLQSFFAMDSGETKTADDYRARAELALVQREMTENERQAMQILNPLYDGSSGETSNYWENV